MPHPPTDLVEEFERRAQTARVLIVGDLMLDAYLEGSASRISPEAPVPVVRVERERHALGGAANVAANVRALGAEAVLLGAVGNDASGRLLLEDAGAIGVDHSAVVVDGGRPTSVKTRVLVRGQQVARYDREVDDEAGPETSAAVIAALEAVPAVHAIVVEDYDKGVLTTGTIRAILDLAARRGIPIVVDPKARNFFAYGGATVFKPNRAELEAALREPARADDAGWMESVRDRLGCDTLVLTLGEEGMAVAAADGTHKRIPTVARSVYDVSGAGDTVAAVLATALAAGFGVHDAATLANQAAGVQVGKAGVATVRPDEIAEAARRGTRDSKPGEAR